jgi:hypothetical protein
LFFDLTTYAFFVYSACSTISCACQLYVHTHIKNHRSGSLTDRVLDCAHTTPASSGCSRVVLWSVVNSQCQVFCGRICRNIFEFNCGIATERNTNITSINFEASFFQNGIVDPLETQKRKCANSYIIQLLKILTVYDFDR